MALIHQKYGPFATLVLTVTSFIGLVYRNVWFNPNTYLFANTGDAIKNYYTFTAQSASDSWIQSTAMNYPFGENFLYLDCIPILTWLIKGLSEFYPGVTDYSVGILHILMMCSLFLSAIFIYLILYELKINRWWAAIGALGIMVMSPQVFRMTGHLALSFAVFIPLTWYLAIRFFKSKRSMPWTIIIAVNILFWFLVHAYLGMIAASFTALQIVAAFFIYEKSRWQWFEKWLYMSIAVVTPVVLFWAFITITDHHVGRTTNPWGFFSNNANLLTVFVPHHGIIRGWLGLVFDFKNHNWDGWAYIGLSSTLITIAMLTGWVQKKRRRSSYTTELWNEVTSQVILRRSMWAAVILLFFSMALPFNLGLQFLLDWFPLIKKFRANGRFAWVFYYVMTVTSIYGLHYVYHRIKPGRLRGYALRGLILGLLFLYIAEGWPYHTGLASHFGQYENTFSARELPVEYREGLDSIDPTAYQAILPLPFYHKGSENFAIEGTDLILQGSMTMAYHTTLPIWGNYATHTSIPEAKKSLQTLAPDYYPKAIEADISSPKDVLIVYSKEKLNPYEMDMLHKSRKIYANEAYELYALPVSRIFESSAAEEIGHFIELQQNKSLTPIGGYFVSDTSGKWWHEGFEDSPSLHRVEGAGSHHGMITDRKPIWSLSAGTLQHDTDYHLSIWFSNFGPNYGQDITNVYIKVNEVMENGDQRTLQEVRPAWSMVINGDWSLVELEFTPQNTDRPIEVFVRGPWRGKGEYYIDELLMRESTLDVYQILESQDGKITGLMKNNQRIYKYY